jgi:hypothetical protein
MAETPEIPEVRDPFERRVALTIAIIAVGLAIMATLGDHAQTEAILQTNHASDQWAFYQAKSLKSHAVASENATLDALLRATQTDDPKTKARIDDNTKEQKRYETDQAEIKKNAEELSGEAQHETGIDNRYHLGAMILQMAIVLCSVAILSRWRGIWIVGILVALAGFAVGLSALLV